MVNPENAKLIEKIKQLREDIAILYEEKNKLSYHVCRNIETDYVSK